MTPRTDTQGDGGSTRPARLTTGSEDALRAARAAAVPELGLLSPRARLGVLPTHPPRSHGCGGQGPSDAPVPATGADRVPLPLGPGLGPPGAAPTWARPVPALSHHWPRPVPPLRQGLSLFQGSASPRRLQAGAGSPNVPSPRGDGDCAPVGASDNVWGKLNETKGLGRDLQAGSKRGPSAPRLAAGGAQRGLSVSASPHPVLTAECETFVRPQARRGPGGSGLVEAEEEAPPPRLPFP